MRNKKKQILRGMFTSLRILFCYTVGLTVYFTFPNHYVLYSIFTMISVLLCVFVMFSNNYWINKWIWVGILIGLPAGYYFFEMLYLIFPSLYEYLHPYLYYGSMNNDGSSLILFVIQFFLTYIILLPIAYDILKTYKQSRFPF